jgi:hypothetical protein
MDKKKILLLLLLILILKTSYSQWFFEIKFVGISAHLKKNPHPHLYKRKFDKNGLFVLNLGVIVSVEKMVYNDLISVKFSQAIFSDCANQLAGFTHMGFRLNKAIDDHHFAIGNGPTLFYRNDWEKLDGYIDEGLFKRKNKYQYRYFWYAGEVTYSYIFENNIANSFTLIPGPPEFATFATGFRIKD